MKKTVIVWLLGYFILALTNPSRAQYDSKCLKVGLTLPPNDSWGNVVPFVDFFKLNFDARVTMPDANGYPIKDAWVSYLSTYEIANRLKTEHVLSWDGGMNSTNLPFNNRPITYTLKVVPNSFQKTATGGKCLVRIDSNQVKTEEIFYSANNMIGIFCSNPTPTTDLANPQHIRNVRLIRAGFENTDYIGHPYNPEYVDQLKPFSEINFQVAQFFFTADTTNNIRWKDRTTPNYITQNSMKHTQGLKNTSYAYEHIIQLCNETKANATVYYPISADDDYIFQMAKLFKDGLIFNQTVSLVPARSGNLEPFVVEKARLHPIYKNDPELAAADYTGRAWKIWKKVFGADSLRIKRPLYISNDLTVSDKAAMVHGKGNFDLAFTQINFFENQIEEFLATHPDPTSYSAQDVYDYYVDAIMSESTAKSTLRKQIEWAKKYNVELLANIYTVGEYGIQTSDSTYIYFNESQLQELNRIVLDTIANIGVSKVFFYFEVPTFTPNKLNKGGVRISANYNGYLNYIQKSNDCMLLGNDAQNTSTSDLIEIFPNPSTGDLTLSGTAIDGRIASMECYNSMGAMVYRGSAALDQPISILRNESAGIYNLLIITQDGKKYHNKVVKID